VAQAAMGFAPEVAARHQDLVKKGAGPYFVFATRREVCPRAPGSAFLRPGYLVGLDTPGGVTQEHRACSPLVSLGIGLDQHERTPLHQTLVQLKRVPPQGPMMEAQ
jgi:hypothetical protein